MVTKEAVPTRLTGNSSASRALGKLGAMIGQQRRRHAEAADAVMAK